MNIIKSLSIITLIGISLISCDKPELIDDIKVNRTDKLIKNTSTTGKTTVKFTLEINDEWDVIGQTESGFEIYSMSYFEGEELIVGNTTYYIDQMNSLVVDYDVNDESKHSFNVILDGEYKIVLK